MSLNKIALAAALVVAAVGAQAAPTYTTGLPTGTYGLPASFTAIGTAGIATESDSNHATPNGVVEGSAYLYTSFAGSSISIANTGSTFSFLWGSPDSFNTVTYQTSLGDFSYSGSALGADFGYPLGGNAPLVFTASLAGGTIDNVVFTSTDIAFEVAVAQAVPEPETYALMAAGLMAIGFVAKRRVK